MRILVIEDNHRLNNSLASSLAHEGYSVDSAYDGQEGQDLAEMTDALVILHNYTGATNLLSEFGQTRV